MGYAYPDRRLAGPKPGPDKRRCVMRIWGDDMGEFDGQYLMLWSPDCPDLICCSADIKDAKRFASTWDAMEFWRQPSGMIRADGEPDRPLLAFNMEFVSVDE